MLLTSPVPLQQIYIYIHIYISHKEHQMETFSALLALCAGNLPVTGELPSQRPVTRSFDVSLICAWINTSVNNCEAGDLIRHRVHYDVIVMKIVIFANRFNKQAWLTVLICPTWWYNQITSIDHCQLAKSGIGLCLPFMAWYLHSQT